MPPKPTLDDWRTLYEAAIRFRETAPWEWMSDTDLFGVQDPETGRIGYCCIMGNLGQHLALAVYLGSEGLQSYLDMLEDEDPDAATAIHAFLNQFCLMASFEGRADLDKEQLNTIRRLKLRFRGQSAWPRFQKLEPPYAPQPLTRPEGRFLTLALDQALDVAHRLKENEALLEPPERGLLLVRVPKETEGGVTWCDRWLAPAPMQVGRTTVPQVDQVRLQRIKNTAKREGLVLEADFMSGPFFINGVDTRKKVSYHPTIMLVVHEYSGFVLAAHVAEPWDYETDFQDVVLKGIEALESVPEAIRVRRPEAFTLVRPIAKALDFELELVEYLDPLDEAYEGMVSAFAGEPPSDDE